MEEERIAIKQLNEQMFNAVLEDNINKVNKAAGDLRDRKVKEDLNYINDARTVYSDFTVLLPRVEEIRGLLDA